MLLFMVFMGIQWPQTFGNMDLIAGELCKTDKEGDWVCRTVENCNHIDVRVVRPPVCSFEGSLPIVCCPPNKQIKKSKAEIACDKYQAGNSCLKTRRKPSDSSETSESSESSESSEKEDELTLLVIGGTPSQPKSHPESVLLGYGPPDSISWVCGGSLISDKWILSAAHCEYPYPNVPLKWVRLGELDKLSDQDDAQPIERTIIRRVPHPNFKLPQVYNDVALYEMDFEVSFNPYVAPICLHTKFEINHPKATVVGWGRTAFADRSSSKLLEANVSIVEHKECSRLLKTDPSTPRGIDEDAMLCAGEREGGKDACKGDSGAPLIVGGTDKCQVRQIGIVSSGRDCGLPNTPGIYTRVSTYVPWIESIVWP